MHVYERWAKAGGLLRYGIPDFKMEKVHVDRRVAQMQAEGVQFHYGADVGVNVPVDKLMKEHDAVVLTGGAEEPRDLPIPGRDLKGIHFAMEFLPQQNRRVSGEAALKVEPILAKGKKVVVIGGGDTGSDCIGTSIRQGAVSVTNFEIMPHAAGARKQDAHLAGLAAEIAHLVKPRGRRQARLRRGDAEILRRERSGQKAALRASSTPSSSRSPAANSRSKPTWCCWPWASCILCMRACSRRSTSPSTIEATSPPTPSSYQTSLPKVFAAGDMRRGQSLVVWAIREGRQAAHAVDKFLMGSTTAAALTAAPTGKSRRDRWIGRSGVAAAAEPAAAAPASVLPGPPAQAS